MEETPHLPNLTKALAISLGVFIIDAFVINAGALGLIAVFMAPWLIMRTLKARGDAALYRRHVTVTCMYVASGLGVLIAIYMLQSTAVKRAETIIEALESHKAAVGTYPADLYELVPDHIDRIPIAKSTYWNKRFVYEVQDGKHVLSIGLLPPTGMQFYVLEEGKWGFRN